MKKLFALLSMSVILALVIAPLGKSESAIKSPPIIEMVKGDICTISNDQFDVTYAVFIPIKAEGVEISPGDVFGGSYYSYVKMDNYNNVAQEIYAENCNKEVQWYRTNDYFICHYINSNESLPAQLAKNYKEYQEVGISPALNQWCHSDTKT